MPDENYYLTNRLYVHMDGNNLVLTDNMNKEDDPVDITIEPEAWRLLEEWMELK